MHYLLLFILSISSFSTLASSFPDDPYIAVIGSASMEVKADQVIIQFQPSSINKNAQLAKETVDKKLSDIVKNINRAGFNSDSLESVSQSTRPEYDYQKNKRILRGVRVTHELSYRLTDISKANLFIDALLKANVKSISALQYGLQQPEQWQDKVRKMAVLDSKLKAQDLAQLYEAKLGNVYSINYQNNHANPVMMRAIAMERSDAINVKPKAISLNDRVETTFLLKR
jgi:uncharacterized protein